MKEASLAEPAPVTFAEPGALAKPGAFARPGALGAIVLDVIELMKLRVSVLVLLTTIAGMALAARALGRSLDLWLVIETILGTGLLASAAAALNQAYEKDRDALMDRTKGRPIASGRMQRHTAVAVALPCFVGGLYLLGSGANAAAAVAGAATFALYVAVYTPLKPRTHLATVIGAVPGALPPVIGWLAAGAPLTGPAWVLFGILFFWQLPHFLAIAWLYRRDYARARFPMLTVVDPSGRAASRQSLTNALALITVSLLPTMTGLSGVTYFWIALGLGAAFLAVLSWLAWSRSDLAARAAVAASIVYLPALIVAMVLDGPVGS